jgi:hypothetical protein
VRERVIESPMPDSVSQPRAASPEAAAPDARAFTPALVSHLQGGAGNAAVARMLQPSGAVLARDVDLVSIASRVHEAVDGLGTDEDAVYAALGELNHDTNAAAQLSRIYLADYGETLEAAIRDDFSGDELTRAMSLLSSTNGAAPAAGSVSPATITAAPVHPPRTLAMDLATGEAVLDGAFGDYVSISRGSIQILDQAEFQAAYDRIYGGGQYSWDNYVVPRYGSLNGFAHDGVNYINRASAGLHTVVHEMLHNNTAADWRGVVGSRWDEGTTEVLTQEACAKVAEPAPVCYPGESPVVREALTQGLPQSDLTEAYFNGGAQQKVADWVDANCTEDWATVKGHMEANRWAAARAGLAKKTT